MLLFIDTETTGLFDYSRPADAPGQPRLAELCGILTDMAGVVIEEKTVLIKPDGWTLSPELTAINGLTTEMCAERGVPVREALDWLAAQMLRCRNILGFGINFDLKVARGEFRRADMDDLYPLGEARKICIQQMARKVTALPKNKTPKLTEAVQIILHEEFKDAHGAREDTVAAMRVYFALMGFGVLPGPSKPSSTHVEISPSADAPAALNDII